jgi:hypothetical protein
MTRQRRSAFANGGRSSQSLVIISIRRERQRK